MSCLYNKGKENSTVGLFVMLYNDATSLQSNRTLVFEEKPAYIASGIISVSAHIDGKKESVPTQYKQPLTMVRLNNLFDSKVLKLRS